MYMRKLKMNPVGCVSGLALLFSVPLHAQLAIVNREKLQLPLMQDASSPVFSTDGKSVYFTNSRYDGIWEYKLADKSVRRITSDPRSGYGFTLSHDRRQIAYRRTVQEPGYKRRQEIVVKDLTANSEAVVERGKDLPLPVFTGNPAAPLRKSSGKAPAFPAGSAAFVLGIENMKIALLVDGRKTVLDPFQGGRYIWPSLSPDGKRLVAYEMDRGAFICDLRGNILAGLGRCDAPSWMRDGKWIVYMDDRDDGKQMISSDLSAVSADGRTRLMLTATGDEFELNPVCSPVENRIVTGTAAGNLYLYTYEVLP
jgi:Tol biopolymer transport system component